VKNEPTYVIRSVDHALRLALQLQQEGELSVSEAATALSVARSTAHRLLAMLVYRGFAEQGDDHRYRAGAALRLGVEAQPTGALRATAMPRLVELMLATRETASLSVLVGDQVRLVATVESEQLLRVGDREGRLLPAHLTSGGLAILAALGGDGIREQAELAGLPFESLRRSLRLVRRRGYAINDQKTEVGVTAVGRVVRRGEGQVPVAISIAVPTARFRSDQLPQWLHELGAAAAAIERDLGV